MTGNKDNANDNTKLNKHLFKSLILLINSQRRKPDLYLDIKIVKIFVFIPKRMK